MRYKENRAKYKQIFSDYKCCIIIPTYNNDKTLASVIDNVSEYNADIIVVNDGSTDNTSQILDNYNDIETITLNRNRGKGFALRKGFKHALEKGYKYAITIDSDGQHSEDDLPAFINKLKEETDAIIVGARNMGQDNIPKKSSFGHKFSNFWFRFETGIKLPDTQSGYRLYPLKLIDKIHFFTNKFEFEIEVLVRSAWRGIKITYVPVSVYYADKEDRISHFRPFADFFRVSVLNTCLVFVALFYAKPFQFIQEIKKNGIRNFIRKHFLSPGESNLNKTFSLMLGIFIGVSPLWGWHTIIVLALAFAFKLNKVIAIVASNISIPPMIPLILFLSYRAGGILLGDLATEVQFSSNLNLEAITLNLLQYITGSFFLGIILAILFGLITFTLLTIFRPGNLNKKPINLTN